MHLGNILKGTEPIPRVRGCLFGEDKLPVRTSKGRIIRVVGAPERRNFGPRYVVVSGIYRAEGFLIYLPANTTTTSKLLDFCAVSNSVFGSWLPTFLFHQSRVQRIVAGFGVSN